MQIAAIAHANKNRHCESVIASVVKQPITMLQKLNRHDSLAMTRWDDCRAIREETKGVLRFCGIYLLFFVTRHMVLPTSSATNKAPV